MKHKFKVGDRVRLIRNSWGVRIGHSDVISNIKDDTVALTNPPFNVELDALELVEDKTARYNNTFKPGDRVRVKPREQFDEYPKNSVGDPIVGGLTLYPPGMTDCCGKGFTVESVDQAGHVGLKETSFIFSSEMLEPVEAEARPSLSAPLTGVIHCTAEALRGMFVYKNPQITDKLPLINTTRLLTSIKLD